MSQPSGQPRHSSEGLPVGITPSSWGNDSLLKRSGGIQASTTPRGSLAGKPWRQRLQSELLVLWTRKLGPRQNEQLVQYQKGTELRQKPSFQILVSVPFPLPYAVSGLQDKQADGAGLTR